MSERLLTPHQVDIARAITAVIHGCEIDDAFRAMISIIAATINDRAEDRDEAISTAMEISSAVIAIVEAGQAGELEMSE